MVIGSPNQKSEKLASDFELEIVEGTNKQEEEVVEQEI